MRLLNVKTLRLSYFEGDAIPKYAIASHRWEADETTYDDVRWKRNTEKAGYKKVINFCSLAENWSPSIEWLWIDTCCIDKKSSAELSESINSMFRWYANAEICFAYLADVSPITGVGWIDAVYEQFKSSIWFTRGWTLQELLASKTVLFLTREWEAFGSKGATTLQDTLSLNSRIMDVTGIPLSVLLDYENSRDCRDDEKWTWVAGRMTTKEEDLAYCLLGIFDINMPLIYGEGGQATVRLREEIRAKKRRLRQQRTSRFSTLSISTRATYYETWAEQNLLDWTPVSENLVDRPVEEDLTSTFNGQTSSTLLSRILDAEEAVDYDDEHDNEQEPVIGSTTSRSFPRDVNDSQHEQNVYEHNTDDNWDSRQQQDRSRRQTPTPTPREVDTTNTGNSQMEIFKSFRVRIDESCRVVLPAALKKYNIAGDWRQYALYIVYDDVERCMGLEESPLLVYKQLGEEGRKPTFMLRKHASPQDDFLRKHQEARKRIPGGVL